jgi:hypothetical protein
MFARNSAIALDAFDIEIIIQPAAEPTARVVAGMLARLLRKNPNVVPGLAMGSILVLPAAN